MRVLLATRNAHKVIEVGRILNASGVGIELIGIGDLDVEVPDVPETGATFVENALIKANAAAQAAGLPTIADDSGLAVDALNGMPGVLSARWAGSHGDDAANLDLVLDQIADVPDERRGARFICAVAYVEPGYPPVTVEGVVEGRLLRERHGDGGFGYDPIFVPAGFDITTAQMSPAEKDSISHRGEALRELANRQAPAWSAGR